jgi:hypothetical protein
MYNHHKKTMRQAETTRGGQISVEILRMGSDVRTVIVDEDSTLRDVLEEAGITLTSTETAWVSGVSANLDDIIEEGDTIQLVGKKEGGLK